MLLELGGELLSIPFIGFRAEAGSWRVTQDVLSIPFIGFANMFLFHSVGMLYLSIPFIGFKPALNLQGGRVKRSFNSLYWVQKS